MIRRLDELGRIVIPKEMRKTLHIKEGTPIDINVEDGQYIILKKYSPIMELAPNAKVCADALFAIIERPVYIVDSDKLVACAGSKLSECSIQDGITKLLENRSISKITDFNKTLFVDEMLPHKNILIAPIIVEGDILGNIIVDYIEYNEVLFSNTKLTADIISKLVY